MCYPAPHLHRHLRCPSAAYRSTNANPSLAAQMSQGKERKVRWCMHDRGKTCPRKQFCDFAHSEQELRQHNPHYKHFVCESVFLGSECKNLMCIAAHSENEWLRTVLGSVTEAPTIAQWQEWMLTKFHQRPCPLQFKHNYQACSGYHLRAWSETRPSDKNDAVYTFDHYHTEMCPQGTACKVCLLHSRH